MKPREWYYYVGDFETTVYEGQSRTDVWASALTRMFSPSDNVQIFGSIGDTFDFLKMLACEGGINIVVYYHNLKFDGSFWLNYLLFDLKLEQAFDYDNKCWLSDFKMLDNTVKYLIADNGAWYTVTVKINGHYIQFRDSLKLLPFSVKSIGKSFDTKHKKLEMEYEGYRYPNCHISEEEKAYIKNDVLVVREALEIMFNEGHNKLSIGSCCLAEFKEITQSASNRKTYFNYLDHICDLSRYKLDMEIYGQPDRDLYIRKAYRGGWCYLRKDRANKLFKKGCTVDVNSLYPSVMSGESGNKYPVGHGTMWTGNYIPEVCENDDIYYFIRIKTRFRLKPGKLPTIQIKDNLLYRATEYLVTSDIYNNKKKKWCSYAETKNGVFDTRVVLTLTCTDFELIKEHYNLYDFEILDGCYFHAMVGIFDEYIEKYKTMKLTSKGARKTLAKLFLNNLYGKLATNRNSSFKVARQREDGSLGWDTIFDDNKRVVYIPAGAAVTSYARNFTIRAAQANYKHFIYADTDSLHCCCDPSDLVGIPIHDKDFLHWKIESVWDEAKYIRQKSYIEHIVSIPGETLEKPFYEIKCAGIQNRSKELFNLSIEGCDIEAIDDNGKPLFNDREKDFLKTKRTIDDFKGGLVLPSATYAKQIPGGTLLYNDDKEIKI